MKKYLLAALLIVGFTGIAMAQTHRRPVKRHHHHVKHHRHHPAHRPHH